MKFQTVLMNQTEVMNFSVTADTAQTVFTACVEFYCVPYLFIASWKLYESYR